MHEIRLVGRGGQGIVTAGELLGKAAVGEGKHAQAIPTFGPERRGALSSCTVRLSDEEILLKYSSAAPHSLIVFDPTIWHTADIVMGLQEGGVLLFNTARSPEEIDEDLRAGTHGYKLKLDSYTLYTVDATAVAMETLKRPITNTAVMGALVGATGLIEMGSIERVLEERFGGKAALNIQAAHMASGRLNKLGG